MFLLLDKKEFHWSINRDYPELCLTRINPGPIQIDTEDYPKDVLELIKKSKENGLLHIFENKAEALEQKEKQNKLDQVWLNKHKRFYKVLLRKDISEIKRHLKQLGKNQSTIINPETKEKKDILEVIKSVEKAQQNRQEVLQLIEQKSLEKKEPISMFETIDELLSRASSFEELSPDVSLKEIFKEEIKFVS